MSTEDQLLRELELARDPTDASLFKSKAEHDAVVRLADLLGAGTFHRARHYVNLLLMHRLMKSRGSLPRLNVRLAVFTPDGRTAVKIRCH